MNKIGTLESAWRYPVKSMRASPDTSASGVVESFCATLDGIEGEVTWQKNNVLSPRDLERGYILLCQSEPLTVDCDD